MQNAKCKIKYRQRNDFMNAISDKSFRFAVRIVRLYRYMTETRKEYILSKQLLRCGTRIGANVAEAERGQSPSDFHAKMCIALKEANETLYWLKLLHATDYLTDSQFISMENDIKEIIALLVSICKKNTPKNK